MMDFNDLMNSNPVIPQFEPPVMPELDLPQWHMWSDTQFGITKKHIEQFEASLDDEHEIALMLTNFGQSVLMQVTDISYEKSVLMVFKGYVDGKSATLIQHINQLSFLLTSVPRSEPDKPKTKIGFQRFDDDSKERKS